MRIPKDLAEKHGYASVEDAAHAINRALFWLRKHPNKKQPVHVQKAVDLYAACDRQQREIGAAARKRLDEMMTWRLWFAVVPDYGRCRKLRRRLRRWLRLHLSRAQMASHFARVLPPGSYAAWGEATPDEKVTALNAMSRMIRDIYGLRDLPGDSAERANDVAWDVWKLLADE